MRFQSSVKNRAKIDLKHGSMETHSRPTSNVTFFNDVPRAHLVGVCLQVGADAEALDEAVRGTYSGQSRRHPNPSICPCCWIYGRMTYILSGVGASGFETNARSPYGFEFHDALEVGQFKIESSQVTERARMAAREGVSVAALTQPARL